MTRCINKKLTSVLLTLLTLTSLPVTSLASETTCDHDYSVTTIAPTCEHTGYTKRECASCGESETTATEDRVDHAYTTWMKNGTSEQHLQICKYCGKTTGTAADCDPMYIDLEEDEPYLAVDLICGTFGDKVAERVDNAVCKIGSKVVAEEFVAVYELENPLGRRYITLGADSEENVLVRHAFTVTLLDDGAMKASDTELSVTVDYSAGSRRNFTLVRVNDDNEWETVEHTYVNGKLTFKTDEAGVFFLI